MSLRLAKCEALADKPGSFGLAHLHVRSQYTARRVGSTIGFTFGVWGNSEVRLVGTDTQALASGAEGISAVAGAGSEQPGTAEAVEKVGATRILVTMIQDSGHLRNFDLMGASL